MKTVACGPETASWRALLQHAARLRDVATAQLFAVDPARRSKLFSAQACGFFLDYSRHRVDQPAMQQLLQMADEIGLRAQIERMWAGDAINATEQRAALHVALRQPAGAQIGGAAIEKQVLTERERVLRFAGQVREGKISGSSGATFNRVVNIGIGGSDLGPAMAVEALRPFSQQAPRCEFVSNVDGCRLADILRSADPQRTLFVVCSKTFTTAETLANARTARQWVSEQLGEIAVSAHFAAVSVNQAAMDEFGIHPDYRFQMWDWVGGRYSVWSSIGVTVAIAIGAQNFQDFLAGAHALDEHFRRAAWQDNLPVLMALLGIWNINFQRLPTLAVLPYDDRLRRFPSYLQQLDMESNGKSARIDGTAVNWDTAPVVWGEPGNNAQHSFFQLLHQGTPRAALDFLLPARSSCGNQAQQDLATANCLAQAEAFMCGQSGTEMPLHKRYPGDRPSSVLLFKQLDPFTLGALLALYEHKVFVQSLLWGINAFDQWGVELGKKLALELLPVVQGAASPCAALQVLVDQLIQLRKGS
jgi:glucose-6-phosphate isomerase